jgi:hypothetical protein
VKDQDQQNCPAAQRKNFLGNTRDILMFRRREDKNTVLFEVTTSQCLCSLFRSRTMINQRAARECSQTTLIFPR